MMDCSKCSFLMPILNTTGGKTQVCTKHWELIDNKPCDKCEERKIVNSTPNMTSRCSKCEYSEFDGEFATYKCKLFNEPLEGKRCQRCKEFVMFLFYSGRDE